jgi:hypothetical protein
MLRDIMIAISEQRTCRHCKRWQNGCNLAGGQMPRALVVLAAALAITLNPVGHTPGGSLCTALSGHRCPSLAAS